MFQNDFQEILDELECKQLHAGLDHIEEVGRTAEEQGVRVLVDAEYTSFNPAIRAITHCMMLKFNKNKPVLQHTFQAYLKVSLCSCSKRISPAKK